MIATRPARRQTQRATSLPLGQAASNMSWSASGHHHPPKVLMQLKNQQNYMLRATRVLHTGVTHGPSYEPSCQTS
ncbi:hypothetical protein BQ8482_220168 [Mesorhizobium delmotii]|uniref:Uncharacterized protein n=1 Tax=Mesorhizobium delmotii TaxID=1631247 RepID=A0A2P9ALI1_9HYPH|nr:hypothetical protein BQ8482_220168 [Mesorhizobium delmotii]